MTRINSAIDPSTLCDKHLVAEYRELPRISTVAWNAYLANRKMFIPDQFVLGKGHVGFFANKGLFLSKRYQSIVAEMRHREFQVSFPDYREHPPGWSMDHTPTDHEVEVLMNRIADRMPPNPKWTRRQPFDFSNR